MRLAPTPVSRSTAALLSVPTRYKRCRKRLPLRSVEKTTPKPSKVPVLFQSFTEALEPSPAIAAPLAGSYNPSFGAGCAESAMTEKDRMPAVRFTTSTA